MQTHTPEISVIIPVYNTSKYISYCLDSIRTQTFTDFECIMVDDGSTDGSIEIEEKYAADDARFKIIKQSHKGIGYAIKAAVLASCGRYINFVDSDDWQDVNTLQVLYENAVKHHADLVVSNFISEYGDRSVPSDDIHTEGFFSFKDGKTPLEQITDKNSNTFFEPIPPVKPGSLFARSLLIDNLDYQTGVHIGEDVLLVLPAFIDARALLIMPEFRPYHYRRNVESTTNGKKAEKLRWSLTYLHNRDLYFSRLKTIIDKKQPDSTNIKAIYWNHFVSIYFCFAQQSLMKLIFHSLGLTKEEKSDLRQRVKEAAAKLKSTDIDERHLTAKSIIKLKVIKLPTPLLICAILLVLALPVLAGISVLCMSGE